MSLEEPTEPEVPLQNEPDEPADDTPETPDTPPTENAPLHRGEATEITETHQYIYAGGKLLRETISDGTTTKTLDFTYDNAGMPYSLIYNSGTTTTTYYYITNLQGDVMYLVDANGVQVAAYDYDPYGKVITSTGNLAEINPLRYRGYYYDTETGFYYLQSRYYDPEICRFINADGYASTGQSYLGYNMFTYCNNAPVSFKDSNGRECLPATPEDEERMQQFMEMYYEAEGTEYVIPVDTGTYTVVITSEHHTQRKPLFPEYFDDIEFFSNFGIEIVGLLGISLKYITELGWVKTLGPWASAALYIAKKIDSNSKDPVPTGDYTTYTITYNYETDVNLYTRSNQHIPKRSRFTDTNKFYFTRTSLTWSYRFRKGEELY